MNAFNMTCSLAALLTTTAIAAPVVADDDALLEEIVVTAQRREQSLQEVPVSVSVVSGKRMQNMLAGGADIRALAGRVPGLNAESSNGRVAPRFYIRGLGNTDFDLAASQPVSVIMDNVVMENVVLKSFPLFDVERVEVLRGPQGTLFGKNTPAGIVKFDTRKPSQEAGGYANVNAGTLETVEVESAYGGPINDTLSFRVSGLWQHRGDYIDNAFTGEDDALGGFDEYAGRLQFMYEGEKTTALLNVHARKNEGTSAIFRANVLGGSNDLNENYDRDTVYFNEGNNNPQDYENMGASLQITHEFDNLILTSITAFETADGSSLGDIDGGNPNGPGFIPFQSATQDVMDDTDQFTQELRIASNGDGDMNWQAGVYYFTSDLSVTTFPFFVPESNVKHENDSISVFAQTDFKVTEKTTMTLGARYTNDQKELEGTAGWAPLTFSEDIEDDRLSWDVALNHEINDQISVYGRLASGFRAASIQGRDIAFFGAPSVARAEEILSAEVGFKSVLLDNRLRLNGAIYKWEMEDQQISAVGGAGNLIQLINVPHTNGYGAEFDAEWAVNENLMITAGFALTETEIESSLLVGTCAQCNVLDPIRGNRFAQVKGNPLPQAPDWSANITARYSVEMGEGELYVYTDWFVEGEKNLFIYESTEFRTNGDFEGNLRVGYIWNDGGYEVSAYAQNITNEHNVKGGIDFNNNTAYVNEPRRFGLTFRANF